MNRSTRISVQALAVLALVAVCSLLVARRDRGGMAQVRIRSYQAFLDGSGTRVTLEPKVEGGERENLLDYPHSFSVGNETSWSDRDGAWKTGVPDCLKVGEETAVRAATVNVKAIEGSPTSTFLVWLDCP